MVYNILKTILRYYFNEKFINNSLPSYSMMNQEDFRKYQTEKELQACGLSAESINAIRSTTVITRDGMQHVVPESQAHLDETNSSSVSEATLTQQVLDVSKMFSRFKQFADKRIADLEKAVSQLQAQVKENQQELLTLKSNHHARSQTPSNLEEAYAQEATHEKTMEIRSSPKRQSSSTKGIDRNNISPDQVQVEKIFYSGTR